jgi:hypothetical protein
MYFTLTGSRLQKREQIRYLFLKYACQEAKTSFFFSSAKYTFWSIFACAWFENSSLYTYRLLHTPFGIIFHVLFIHFWPSHIITDTINGILLFPMLEFVQFSVNKPTLTAMNCFIYTIIWLFRPSSVEIPTLFLVTIVICRCKIPV